MSALIYLPLQPVRDLQAGQMYEYTDPHGREHIATVVTVETLKLQGMGTFYNIQLDTDSLGRISGGSLPGDELLQMVGPDPELCRHPRVGPNGICLDCGTDTDAGIECEDDGADAGEEDIIVEDDEDEIVVEDDGDTLDALLDEADINRDILLDDLLDGLDGGEDDEEIVVEDDDDADPRRDVVTRQEDTFADMLDEGTLLLLSDLGIEVPELQDDELAGFLGLEEASAPAPVRSPKPAPGRAKKAARTPANAKPGTGRAKVPDVCPVCEQPGCPNWEKRDPSKTIECPACAGTGDRVTSQGFGTCRQCAGVGRVKVHRG